ncbi:MULTISPECIES: shikimate kinase [Micromonospora]|uniref:Shikimate kinase n=2 Tax=Micromonospora TaxID=1873 RepID=A0A9X0I961_9ACTN|nr:MULTISPECIES: shikimate kinase [Micromonospora]AEB44100.1 shikimate kinase [Micromonospora maris AB-18-032]KUJ49315.1 shikimate kinase [Micromonospora maris]PMR60272.1 shikimate kinase [Verrucosispora sp. ts21]RUL91240.1 shikimate kinase [Verrucosispora sp. FIM060022]GIJ17697.1 shikimate kinase [Micromonospora gifhornensis]
MTGRTRPVCVLVGAPGSGKTTVGEVLAAELGVEFRDTDADIERLAGKPIPEIFVDEGEEHFRALERAAVAAALASCDGVLALGGGAVLAEENRAALVGHQVVHLSVELTDAVKRVGLGVGRPLLAINPRATLKHLMDQRRPLYAEVATVTVVTDGRTPQEIAAEIIPLLKR